MRRETPTGDGRSARIRARRTPRARPRSTCARRRSRESSRPRARDRARRARAVEDGAERRELVAKASNSSRGIDPGVVAPTLEHRGDECEVADDVLRVVVSNDDASARARGRSAIKLRVKSIPGLLRSVAWVLHGLDLAAHECAIATDAKRGRGDGV